MECFITLSNASEVLQMTGSEGKLQIQGIVKSKSVQIEFFSICVALDNGAIVTRRTCE